MAIPKRLENHIHTVCARNSRHSGTPKSWQGTIRSRNDDYLHDITDDVVFSTKELIAELESIHWPSPYESGEGSCYTLSTDGFEARVFEKRPTYGCTGICIVVKWMPSQTSSP